jgi:hypothetical protein
LVRTAVIEGLEYIYSTELKDADQLEV